MSRVPCLACGGPVVLDPNGVCPEGHLVGEAGAGMAPGMRSVATHPDETEPWHAAVEPDAHRARASEDDGNHADTPEAGHEDHRSGGGDAVPGGRPTPLGGADDLDGLHALERAIQAVQGDGARATRPTDPEATDPEATDPSPPPFDPLDDTLWAAVDTAPMTPAQDPSGATPGPTGPTSPAPSPPPPGAGAGAEATSRADATGGDAEGEDGARPIDEARHGSDTTELEPPEPTTPPVLDVTNFTAKGHRVGASGSGRRRRFGR